MEEGEGGGGGPLPSLPTPRGSGTWSSSASGGSRPRGDTPGLGAIHRPPPTDGPAPGTRVPSPFALPATVADATGLQPRPPPRGPSRSRRSTKTGTSTRRTQGPTWGEESPDPDQYVEGGRGLSVRLSAPSPATAGRRWKLETSDQKSTTETTNQRGGSIFQPRLTSPLPQLVLHR